MDVVGAVIGHVRYPRLRHGPAIAVLPREALRAMRVEESLSIVLLPRRLLRVSWDHPSQSRPSRPQVISIYLNDYLQQQRGLSIHAATGVITLFGTATAAGQVVGAKAGQELYNRKAVLQPVLMGVGARFDTGGGVVLS